MNPFYNIGIQLFRTGVKLVSPRNPKARKMLEGQRHTIERVATAFPPGSGRPVWIHAASLGEFEQGRPLIERLRRERPDVKILLTFFSPSGYEVRKNYKEADCVCYLPFDTPDCVREFLDAADPSVAIFVKYEFWGNYLQELRRRGIPVYLISAIFRESQSFFRWWGGMFRNMLRCYNRLFVQDDNSARLLAGLGVTNVEVAGDTRFDRVTDIMRGAPDTSCIQPFLESAPATVMVAGSSWEPDEKVFLPVVNSRDDVALIIAPHEFDGERLRAIERSVEGRTVRYSELERDPEAGRGAKCVIVDCFGKLAGLYRCGDIAYVGGGFGAGIHNINEAAVYGIPVVYGPNNGKFKEARDMAECGGGFPIRSAEEGRDVLSRLLDSTEFRKDAGKKAGDYIQVHLGATDKIYDALFGDAR